MEEGEADLDPGCDCETPPARDLGLPDLSGVPEGSPPPGPTSLGFLGRAETQSLVSQSNCRKLSAPEVILVGEHQHERS